MANKGYDKEDGVWRTIGGRKVFIRNGQSLSDAMKESGKFKGAKKEETKKEDNVEKAKKEKDEKEKVEYLNGDTILDELGSDAEGISAMYEKLGYNEDEIWDEVVEDADNEKLVIKEKDGKRYFELNKDGKTMTYNGRASNNDLLIEEKEKNSANDKFLEKAKALDDRDKGKISEEDYNLTYYDENGQKKSVKYSELKEKANKEWQENEKKLKPMVDKEKSDPYDDPESEESQRLQSIQSRYDDYLQKTEGRGASYGELSYVENLRGKDLDDFEKELDDFESKNEKTANETMNDKIRSKASKKSSFREDLPKHTEIKEQGNSNRKEVSENIQAHILDYYDSPQDFVEQMEYMKEPTMWHAGEKLAEGGSYAISYYDQREFLDSLKINPKGKDFDDEKVWQTYKSLIGRESAKLYDRLKKNAFNKYKQEHPLTKMTFEEFKKQK